MTDAIRHALEASRSTIDALLADDGTLVDIQRLAEAIGDALAGGGKVWLFGNGGSAADAQHIAAELVGRFKRERRALPAESLTVNTSILTAIANDYGFDAVFARQLEAGARPGDVAIGITTSGKSRNVLEGLRTARGLGARTAVLAGADAGDLRDVVDDCIAVPSTETPRVQECHILIGHVLCELVEERLAESES
jgi:D-sedoheptulose 7-phosphate isomerase